MSDDLAKRKCKPCEGGVDPLTKEQSEQLLRALHGDWQLSDDGRAISRTYKFPTYGRTVGFANAAAWIAMTEDHHPDLFVSYDECKVCYTTHAIDGLSDNDFICAAKTDALMPADD